MLFPTERAETFRLARRRGMSYAMTKSPPSRSRPKPPSFLTETPSSSGADADTGRFRVQRQEQMSPIKGVTSMTHSRSVVIDTSPGPRRGAKLPALGTSASVPELEHHVPTEVDVVQALAMPLGRRLMTRWSSLELASLDKLRSAVEKSIEDGRMEEKVKQRAVKQHQGAKQGANEAWAELRFADCIANLSKSLDVDSRSDVLHRYRSSCHSRLGSHALALSDARHAVALNPKGPSNLFVAARALQHSAAMATDPLDKRQRHSEAGPAYCISMRLGFPGGSADPAGAKYAHLLGSIRRERDFGNIVRPNSEKRLSNNVQHRYPPHPNTLALALVLDLALALALAPALALA